MKIRSQATLERIWQDLSDGEAGLLGILYARRMVWARELEDDGAVAIADQLINRSMAVMCQDEAGSLLCVTAAGDEVMKYGSGAHQWLATADRTRAATD